MAKRLVLRKEESGRSFGVGRIGELKMWYWVMRVTVRRQGVGTACGLGLIHENGIPDWEIASRRLRKAPLPANPVHWKKVRRERGKPGRKAGDREG